MTFSKALDKLDGRDSRKIANNTYLERIAADAVAVVLHGTAVVTFRRDGTCTLDSGGWKTATTKDRINNFSPFRVSQVRGVWLVRINGDDVPFVDGMTFATT
jgi:hypothetical protein